VTQNQRVKSLAIYAILRLLFFSWQRERGEVYVTSQAPFYSCFTAP